MREACTPDRQLQHLRARGCFHLESGRPFPLAGIVKLKIFHSQQESLSQLLNLIQTTEYLGSDCSVEGPGLGTDGDSEKKEMDTDIRTWLN